MVIREVRWTLQHASRKFRHEMMTWFNYLRAWKGFWLSYRRYKQISPEHIKTAMEYLHPCFGDDIAETPVEPVYFYQDAWAFGKIVQRRPELHIDVGSHHKFVSLLCQVIPLTMVDIRPLSLPLDTLEHKRGSILNLPFEDDSVISVSSLCVVEHVGLGRYGDALDPYGSEKAIAELKRIVKPGGDLYLSLPLDDENRTYFNAHRAFKEEYILSLFEPFQTLESRYIYSSEFCHQAKSGFGIGCYHLRCPQ